MVRCKKPRHTRRWSHKRRLHYVIERLQEDWSQETMAGCLKLDHPRDACLRISPEGIYRWIYEDAAQGGSLYQHLLRWHRKRLRQQQYGTGHGLIPNCVSIHDRPLSIGNHRRLGRWEDDSVEGAKGSGGIVTHVERKSRVLVAAKLSGKSTDTFYLVTITAFKITPEKWCKILMVDNGKECAQFGKIEEATGMDVYFADPYSPWQRGTNENTNGLLHTAVPLARQ